jgi:hypothetical protein
LASSSIPNSLTAGAKKRRVASASKPYLVHAEMEGELDAAFASYKERKVGAVLAGTENPFCRFVAFLLRSHNVFALV